MMRKLFLFTLLFVFLATSAAEGAEPRFPQKQIEVIKKAIVGVVKKVTNVLKKQKDKLEDIVESAGEKAGEKMEQAKEAAQGMADAAKEKIDDATDRAEEAIDEMNKEGTGGEL